MTDRELLELAAKAAGVRYDVDMSKPKDGRVWWGLWLQYDDEPGEYARRYWNPLTDDGDALRLAVKLHMNVSIHPNDGIFADAWTEKTGLSIECFQPTANYPCAAARRAIVRAAAEIGRAM